MMDNLGILLILQLESMLPNLLFKISLKNLYFFLLAKLSMISPNLVVLSPNIYEVS